MVKKMKSSSSWSKIEREEWIEKINSFFWPSPWHHVIINSIRTLLQKWMALNPINPIYAKWILCSIKLLFEYFKLYILFISELTLIISSIFFFSFCFLSPIIRKSFHLWLPFALGIRFAQSNKESWFKAFIGTHQMHIGKYSSRGTRKCNKRSTLSNSFRNGST